MLAHEHSLPFTMPLLAKRPGAREVDPASETAPGFVIVLDADALAELERILELNLQSDPATASITSEGSKRRS